MLMRLQTKGKIVRIQLYLNQGRDVSEHSASIWPGCLSGIYPKDYKVHIPQRRLYINGYYSAILNSWGVECAQMSNNRRVNYRKCVLHA